MTERKVLGRGLRALIPEVEETKREAAQPIRLSRIRSNPKQPREVFSKEGLEELIASIRENGIVQPILVRPKDDFFEIVCGERRFRAAQVVGLQEIPAVVRTLSDVEALRCSIVENVQRNDLNPVEEAHAYKRLMDEFHMTQEQVADVVGKDRSSVSNTIRLLALPQKILTLLVQGRLTMGHARAILSQKGEEAQWRLCEEILTSNLSVRDVEKIGQRKTQKKLPTRDEAIRHVEEELQRVIGTKVRIADRKGRGKIVLSYYSAQERERLIRLLKERKNRGDKTTNTDSD